MKRICVYCGSSSGKDPAFKQYASLLAKELVSRNIGLVYGGASVGIMGEVANKVMELGGKVTGIIPQALAEKEVSHHGLTELKVVDSMHTRKAMMAELSDGFIALPGGLGTLEELFEILTWAQLGFHRKPCAVLNIKHYYDALFTFLDHTVDQELVKPVHRDMLLINDDPADLLDAMVAYDPPELNKWINSNQT